MRRQQLAAILVAAENAIILTLVLASGYVIGSVIVRAM